MTENTSDQISLSDTSICRECQAELHCTCMKVSKFVDESKKKITIDQRLEIDNSLPLTDAYFTNIGGDQHLVLQSKQVRQYVSYREIKSIQPIERQALLKSTIKYQGEYHDVYRPVQTQVPTKTIRGYYNQEDSQFFSMEPKVFTHQHLSKIISDNNITFDQKVEDFTTVYFDLEVVNTRPNNQFPSVQDPFSHVLSIQMLICQPGKADEKIIYLYNPSHMTYEPVEGTQVIEFSNEIQMVDSFVELLDTLGQVILIGYNSSQSRITTDSIQHHLVGFDLPFILSRCSFVLTPVCKNFRHPFFTAQSCIEVIKIQQKSWFILDALPFVAKYLKTAKISPESLKLSDVAKALGTEQKGECDFQYMNRAFISGGNVSDVLKYGIQDVIVLKQLVDTTQHIPISIGLAKYLNVPLSYTLHNTLMQCLEMHYLQHYRTNGFFPTYQPRYEAFRPKFKGAFTYNNPDKHLFLCPSVQYDVTSLYPSLQIREVLSPELFGIEGRILTCDDEDMEFTMGNGSGLMTDLLDKMLTDRVRIKKSLDDLSGVEYRNANLLQNVLKTCLNGTYGALGAKSNSLCCFPLSSRVTYCGRQVITQAMAYFKANKYEIQNVDTDGITITLSNQQNCFTDVDNLCKALNAHIHELNGERLNFEFTEIHLASVNISKKSYIVSYLDSKKMKTWDRSNAYELEKEKMKTRGVRFSGLSNVVAEKLEQFCFWLLKGVYQPMEALLTLQNNALSMVRDAILSRDIDTLTLFADRIKNNEKHLAAKSIRTRFPQLQNKHTYDILYTIHPNLTQSKIPLEVVEENWYNLDALKITKGLVNRAKKIVKSSLTKLELKDFEKDKYENSDFNRKIIQMREEQDHGMIIVRCVYKTDNGHVKHSSKSISIDEIEEFVSNFDGEVHEYLQAPEGKSKIVFDVDHSYGFSIQDILGFIQDTFREILQISPTMYFLKNSHKDAFHIYSDMKIDRQFNMAIAREINAKAQLDLVDVGIYHNMSQLRLPFSRKLGKEGMYKIPQGDDFLRYLVSYTEDNTPVIETPIQMMQECAVDEHYRTANIDISDKDLSLLHSHLSLTYPGAFSLEMKEKIIRVKMQPPYKCTLCETYHDSENNFFAYVTRDAIVLRCSRSNKLGDMQSKCHKIDKQNTEKYSASTEIKKFTDLKTYVPLSNSIQQNNRYFKLTRDQLYKTTFIKSCLGTGKTEVISGLVKQMNLPTVILSHRISLSQSLKTRYPTSKLYSEIEGPLFTDPQVPIICQIESIKRIRGNIGILVIDEIESILTQLCSSVAMKQQAHEYMWNAIQRAQYLIISDGYLSQSTVDLISRCRDPNTTMTYENMYMPYTDKKCQVMVGECQATSFKLCQDAIDDTQGKLCMSVTLYANAKAIYDYAIGKGKKIIFMHGHNDEAQDEECTETHLTYKNRMISEDINQGEWDILLYTGSVSAGIDIQVPVEKTICWYSRNTNSPLDFVQGTLRCRRFNSMLVMLPSNDIRYRPVSPLDTLPYALRFTWMNITCQLSTFCSARDTSYRFYQRSVIVRQLSLLGMKMEITDMEKLEQKSDIKKITSAPINVESVTKQDVELVDKIISGQVNDDQVILSMRNKREYVQLLRNSGFGGIEHEATDLMPKLIEYFKNDPEVTSKENEIQKFEAILRMREANLLYLRRGKKDINLTDIIAKDASSRKKLGKSATTAKAVDESLPELKKRLQLSDAANKFVLSNTNEPMQYTSFDVVDWQQNSGMTLKQIQMHLEKLLGIRGYLLIKTERGGRTQVPDKYKTVFKTGHTQPQIYTIQKCNLFE